MYKRKIVPSGQHYKEPNYYGGYPGYQQNKLFMALKKILDFLMKPGKLLLIESCVYSKFSCIKYGLKDIKYYTEYISYCILTSEVEIMNTHQFFPTEITVVFSAHYRIYEPRQRCSGK